MFDASIMRRLEVLQGETWTECPDLGRLMPGDVFRMFEPSGEPVVGDGGWTEWTVLETPVIKCMPSTLPAELSNVRGS